MQNPRVSPRALEIPALKRAIIARRPALELGEPDSYRAARARAALTEGATAYLAPITQALTRRIKIPEPFNDHVLTRGPLKGLRSVIVGEVEASDITFVLLYERARQKINLLWVDQHDDAYETANLL